MVHAPPAGVPGPYRGDDDHRPRVLTDERGRRYALVPLAADDMEKGAQPQRGAELATSPTGASTGGGAGGTGEGTATPDAAGSVAPWRLTPREADVALRVARGLPNKRIAHECGMREGTVKSHIHRLFHKLHVTSRVELVLRLQEGVRRGD